MPRFPPTKVLIFPQRSGCLKLLRYLAQEALAGRGETLNQRLIAVNGLGAGEDFDPAKNSIVRVQVRRLRVMLEKYYRRPGCASPWRVRLPERSFGLVFESRGLIRPPVEPPTTHQNMMRVWQAYTSGATIELAASQEETPKIMRARVPAEAI